MDIASLTKGIAYFGWLLFFGLLVYVFLRVSRNRPLRSGYRLLVGTGIAAIALTLLGAGMVFIQPSERGMVISAVASGGYRPEAFQPGIHWIIPFAETVVRYPVSKQTYTMSGTTAEGQVSGDDSISARTADGQQIFVDASVIYQVDPDNVVQLHLKWQDRYQDELVRPQARGVIYDMASKFNVEEIISSKRDLLTKNIHDTLAEKFSQNGLQLVDFVLRNITFSSEYAASVEQKQIADQQAQQARLVVEQKKQEAEQARQVAQGQADAAVIAAKGAADARLIQAQAEAKALETINTALKDNPELLTYQYINKLAPSIQTMLLPNNTPLMLPMPTMAPPAPIDNPTPAPSPTSVPTAVPTPTK